MRKGLRNRFTCVDRAIVPLSAYRTSERGHPPSTSSAFWEGTPNLAHPPACSRAAASCPAHGPCAWDRLRESEIEVEQYNGGKETYLWPFHHSRRPPPHPPPSPIPSRRTQRPQERPHPPAPSTSPYGLLLLAASPPLYIRRSHIAPQTHRQNTLPLRVPHRYPANPAAETSTTLPSSTARHSPARAQLRVRRAQHP
jgi:hypothetical protein